MTTTVVRSHRLRILVALAFAIVSRPARGQGVDLTPGFEPGPTPELERLAFLEGVWEIQPYFRDQQGSWIRGRSSTSQITRIVGGAFFYEEYVVYFGNQPWKAVCIRSYDRFSRVYRTGYFDDLWALFDVYEGHFDGERLIVSNEETGTHFIGPDGLRGMARTVIYDITDDRFVLEWENSFDEGATWETVLRWVYVRTS